MQKFTSKLTAFPVLKRRALAEIFSTVLGSTVVKSDPTILLKGRAAHSYFVVSQKFQEDPFHHQKFLPPPYHHLLRHFRPFFNTINIWSGKDWGPIEEESSVPLAKRTESFWYRCLFSFIVIWYC
eukprot:TRINITY_DN7027_c0_g1_i1.p1 TRINITY_DN7027_c0_g1~~TRINITY_DN7027_c0_g1_i1.p1  ORF type:complete len:125 (+),score=1.83 TRINITY_DN7027_c0_g1_i1:54-428(+)